MDFRYLWLTYKIVVRQLNVIYSVFFQELIKILRIFWQYGDSLTFSVYTHCIKNSKNNLFRPILWSPFWRRAKNKKVFKEITIWTVLRFFAASKIQIRTAYEAHPRIGRKSVRLRNDESSHISFDSSSSVINLFYKNC